jgi:pyruvate dehydrogenase E2 component (dihydrolipoamide acetyltransferase)
MADFLMPSLGADMTAGTLVAWKIKPGDTIARGQVVAEVETDKGVIDVECFDAGVVEKIVAAPGQTLAVGAVMAVIDGATDTASSVRPLPQQPDPGAVSAQPPPNITSTSSIDFPGPRRVKATPLARKRASELGVDLGRVKGTGAGGVIEANDVEQAKNIVPATTALDATLAQPEDGRDRMRRAIAAAMSKSKQEIPHYYLQTTIDMTQALAWLEAENLKRTLPNRILPAVLLLKSVALTLRDVPELNGSWIDGRIQLSERIHVGLAIAMKGGGLVAPAIHDTDRKSLDELMKEIHDLIPRARSGRLRSSEMTDATVTLTNLGDLGVETVYGVIYPPQLAIVGLGKIMKRPWVENDSVCVRSLLNVTLAADHRATDGRIGAKFLEALDRRLRSPEQL